MRYGYTKQGAVQVIKEDGGRVEIRQAGKKKTVWVSKTQLIDPPGNARLCKRSPFDQKCGCTSIVDIAGRCVEAYNVYGKLEKYVSSGEKKGLATSPHLRRKFLKENGFVRARGIKRTVKDVAAEMYKHMHNGYKMSEVRARKATKKAAPAPAPATETAAV